MLDELLRSVNVLLAIFLFLSYLGSCAEKSNHG
jgi:hypothetical protein